MAEQRRPAPVAQPKDLQTTSQLASRRMSSAPRPTPLLAPGSFQTRRSFVLALAAALVASVERVRLAVLYDEYLFHGTAKGPNRDPDQFEAIQFSG
jgi:hypothetical protein